MVKLGPQEDINLWYWGTEELSTPKPYKMQTMAYQQVEGTNIFVIHLNVPKKLNPITLQNSWEYLLLLEHVRRDDRCGIILWTGAGRAFCSGGDFSNWKLDIDDKIIEGYIHAGISWATKDVPSDDIALAGMTNQMLRLEKISVCACNGLAMGGGINFAFLLHDYCVVADDAIFKYPFSELGITPEVGSSILLAQFATLPRAKELMMLGRTFDAKKVYEYGLVNDVAPKEEVYQRAMDVALRLSSVSQYAFVLNLQKIAYFVFLCKSYVNG